MKRLAVTALTFALLALPAVGSPAGAAAATCNGVKATIVGNDRPNIIRGTSGRDVIVARGGRDTIYGRGGNDLICAGKGRDVVKGGDGKDKIFGQSGNDKLKGGAGFDRLDGGPDKDACYVNAGGGKKIRCEEADLRVRVTGPFAAPGKADSEDKFTITWRLKNIGTKRAVDVVLVLDYNEIGVTCRGVDDVSDTYPLGTYAPGQWGAKGYFQDCDAPDPGPTGEVELKATVTTASADDDKSNNTDSATVVIEP